MKDKKKFKNIIIIIGYYLINILMISINITVENQI